MKKEFLSLIFVFCIFFPSCKNVKIEDDYYYSESHTLNDMTITLKGTGYGLYGQLIEKYKRGSLQGLMQGEPLIIKSSSADEKNSSYNEIFLTVEKNGYVSSFNTGLSVSKISGLTQVKVSYKDENDKEFTLASGYPLAGPYTIGKNVKSITLYIKGFKYYPLAYNSLLYKGDLTEATFAELAGDQVDNEFTINYLRVE